MAAAKQTMGSENAKYLCASKVKVKVSLKDRYTPMTGKMCRFSYCISADNLWVNAVAQ